MRFGAQVNCYRTSWDEIRAVIDTMEAGRWSSLWFADHFVPPPGPREDEPLPALEGYTLIAAAAGMTEKLRLGHLVLGNTYRNPALVAKMASTLDQISHCRFVLGTTSGICDIAMLFDVPRIGTNWLPLGSAPWGRHCLFIPTLLRDRGSGQLLPFERFLEDTRGPKSDLLWSPLNRVRFVFEDNAPEDILAVTEEMMARLDGNFTESEEDRAMQARYLARFPADHWSAEVRTPMGRDFLAKHQAYFLES